jgi:hypothetical protein
VIPVLVGRHDTMHRSRDWIGWISSAGALADEAGSGGIIWRIATQPRSWRRASSRIMWNRRPRCPGSILWNGLDPNLIHHAKVATYHDAVDVLHA